MRHSVAVAALGLALVVGGTLGTWGKGKEKFVVGSDTSFPWTTKGINTCREEGKPVLLYIYSPAKDDKTLNPTAEILETKIFKNDFVKEAFKDFTPVKLSVKNAEGWPPEYAGPVDRNSAVLMLMTCDCLPIPALTYVRQNLPKIVKDENKRDTCPELIAVAKQLLALNPAALERMKKKPPAKWVAPSVAKVAVGEKAEKGGEVAAPPAPSVPGLADAAKTGAKAADTKAPAADAGAGNPAESKPGEAPAAADPKAGGTKAADPKAASAQRPPDEE